MLDVTLRVIHTWKNNICHYAKGFERKISFELQKENLFGQWMTKPVLEIAQDNKKRKLAVRCIL